jgi:hypothetical protein
VANIFDVLSHQHHDLLCNFVATIFFCCHFHHVSEAFQAANPPPVIDVLEATATLPSMVIVVNGLFLKDSR